MTRFDFQFNKWIESKIFLQVFSLALAVVLWLFVVGGRDESVIKEFDVRLEFLNPPPNLTVTPSVRTVAVTLKGERRAIAALTSSSLVSDVDLTGLSVGRAQRPVRVAAPSRIEIMSVDPSSVGIDLAQILERQLPVHVELPSDVPAGYTLRDQIIEPPKVTIRGRQQDVSPLDHMIVRPSLGQLEAGGPWNLTVQPPSGPANVDVTPATVKVTATYLRGLPEKAVAVKIDTEGELSSHLMIKDIELTPSTVYVEGAADALKGVTALRTTPLNLTGLTEDIVVSLAVVTPPAPLRLVGDGVVKAAVTLAPRREEKVFESIPVEIRFTGTSLYPGWKADPDRVTIRAQVEPGQAGEVGLGALRPKAYVDVTNVVSRSLRVPVRVEYNKSLKGIAAVTAQPETVRVMAQDK